MKHKLFIISIFLYPFIAFCQIKNIEIDPSRTYQEIDHFTASDAWSGNFVGMHWAEEEKDKIANGCSVKRPIFRVIPKVSACLYGGSM